MKFYISDIIGTKSGMNYYLDSFSELLIENKIENEILSNYATPKDVFYPNVFQGNKICKAAKLTLCFLKFFYKILSLKKDEYIIHLTYGTIIDFLFICIAQIRNKKVVLDIHETIILDNKSDSFLKRFEALYSIIRNDIIYHSDKIKAELFKHNAKSRMLFVPHMHYSLRKSCSLESISDDIKTSAKKGYVNLLFFGNIRQSKGIYELIDLIKKCEETKPEVNLNFIIAGQDIFNILEKIEVTNFKNVLCKLISRHITDDEMCFLFQNSDYALLPYNEISQSGVLEAAVDYRLKLITSNIDYFVNIIKKFPSFGFTIDFKNENSSKTLISLIKEDNQYHYSQKDIIAYYKKDDFEMFINQLKKVTI